MAVAVEQAHLHLVMVSHRREREGGRERGRAKGEREKERERGGERGRESEREGGEAIEGGKECQFIHVPGAHNSS